MEIDVNQMYCFDLFVICTIIESLYCMPENNTMLYGNYTSIKKRHKHVQ